VLERVPPRFAGKRKTVAAIGATSARATHGSIRLGNLNLACALGRGGRRALKREGDGGTPVGSFPALAVLYRPDRVRRPLTGLPIRPIGQGDGWCDAPADRNYNRPVRYPYAASAETLWRSDRLYDVVVVLGYNMRPRSRGRGSAIFVHLAKPGYAPTEGCIALKLEHLLLLLRCLRIGSHIKVLA
jgi:L,D-peptidoglycan transpeptidase YkuD (ErfK/YbiS/YcfS/YnhG family)